MEFTISIPEIEWTWGQIQLACVLVWYIPAYFIVLLGEWYWRSPNASTDDIMGARFFCWMMSPLLVVVCTVVAIFWLLFGRWSK